MGRKSKLVVAGFSLAAILIVAFVVAIALRANHNSARPSGVTTSSRQPSPEKSSDASAAPRTSALPEFTAANANMLEKAMESRDKNEQAKALAPELRKGSWKPADVLPDGATLKIDRSSFKTNMKGEATVNASVRGSVQAEFVLQMMPAGEGQWLIYVTQRK